MTVNDFIADKFAAKAQLMVDEMNVLQSEIEKATRKGNIEAVRAQGMQFVGLATALRLLGFDYEWNSRESFWFLLVPENASEVFGL